VSQKGMVIKMNNKKFIKKARTADVGFGWTAVALSIVLVPCVFLVSATVLGVISDSVGDFFKAILYGIVFGLFWLYAGIRALLRAERVKQYINIFGAYPRIKMSELIKKTSRTLKTISADLNVIKKRCGGVDMSFDLDNKEIILSQLAESAEPLPSVGNDSKTVYSEKKSLPIFAIVAGTVSFICFSFSVVFAVAIGVGGFFLAWKFFPSPVYFIEVARSFPAVKASIVTGNVSLDEALASIFENKKELLRLSQSIVSPKIRTPLEECLRVLDQIADYVTANPEKVKSLRQFNNYYLPTTVSFLQTYEELEQKPHKGDNITAALVKIEEVTANMTSVFKREHDDLYCDRVMDISAEAAVMQAIIKENKNIL